jgi:hypothetical protein
MIIDALFTIVTRWTQPLDNESVVCRHNGRLFIYKKDEILSFVTAWMRLEIVILNEISTERQILRGLTRGL